MDFNNPIKGWQKPRSTGFDARAPAQGGPQSGVGQHAADGGLGQAERITSLAVSQTQVATLFENIRGVLGRSVADLAALLGTAPSTINALETGNFAELPDWAETQRVVCEYTGLVDIDPQPTLFVLEKCLPHYGVPTTIEQSTTASIAYHVAPSAWTTQPQLKSSPSGARPHNPAPVHHEQGNLQPRPQHSMAHYASGIRDVAPDIDQVSSAYAVSTAISETLSNLTSSLLPLIATKRAIATGGVIALVTLGAITAVSSPSVARFARDHLPASIARAVATAHNVISPPKEFTKDGMRWIVVSDPRSRRTDRLPVPDE